MSIHSRGIAIGLEAGVEQARSGVGPTGAKALKHFDGSVVVVAFIMVLFIMVLFMVLFIMVLFRVLFIMVLFMVLFSQELFSQELFSQELFNQELFIIELFKFDALGVATPGNKGRLLAALVPPIVLVAIGPPIVLVAIGPPIVLVAIGRPIWFVAIGTVTDRPMESVMVIVPGACCMSCKSLRLLLAGVKSP